MRCQERRRASANGIGWGQTGELKAAYADTHVRFSPFTDRPTSEETNPGLENWFVDNSRRGFFRLHGP